MRRVLFAFLLGLLSHLYPQSLKVNVKAQSAILYNPENGAILFQKRAKEPHYPASILKIATALFALEQNIELERPFLATRGALETIHADKRQADPLSYPPYIIEHDGVTIGLEEGKSYSALSLLHGLLLESANDAANVLAEGIGGTIPKFMEELNQYLQKKGIHQTRFQNPHGLYHPAQMTTAYDMALIAGLAFQNPVFCQIVKTPQFKLDHGRILTNTSRFLKEGKYQYPKYIGGKTGYTASSGYNLVAAAEHGGRRLVAVVLGCKHHQDRFEDAISLFEAAFQEKEIERLLFSKEHQHFFRKDGKGKQILTAELHEDVAISYFPSEESELQAKLIWYKGKSAVGSDRMVGKLLVENEWGREIFSAPLFAAREPVQARKAGKLLWLLAPLTLLVLFQLSKKRGKVFKG